MNSVTQIIEKVATAARKAVLLGALVGGVSMVSFATETTGTNAGPAIEKAQLETVHINLEAVVAAITKVDPDWVKGLTVAANKMTLTEHYYEYTGDTHDDLDVQNASNWSYIGDEEPGEFPCEEQEGLMCGVKIPADPSQLATYLTTGTGVTFNQLKNDNRIETYQEDPQQQ